MDGKVVRLSPAQVPASMSYYGRSEALANEIDHVVHAHHAKQARKADL